MKRKDVTSWTYLFREVVLDRQRLRDGHLECFAHEQPYSHVVQMQTLHAEVTDICHDNARRIIEFETSIREMLLSEALPAFETWLRLMSRLV